MTCGKDGRRKIRDDGDGEKYGEDSIGRGPGFARRHAGTTERGAKRNYRGYSDF